MGQRAVPSRNRGNSASHEAEQTDIAIFRTPLGWFGLAGRGGIASRVSIGHATAGEVRRRLFYELNDADERDWHPDLRRRLTAYAAGDVVEFGDVSIDLDGATPFQQRVLNALRLVDYGTTLSYAQLAERAGAPGAARAVGQVMAHNRLPVIIPCHRVLASGGGIGGFSAPQGITLKQRLLALERRWS
jgi:methylated-DNA-[protein]-cysteine S-methyltransferase